MTVTSCRSRPTLMGARRLLYALAVWAGLTCVPVRADVTTLEGLHAPIVRINVHQGPVTVRTWDRDVVQIEADPSVVVLRRSFQMPAAGSLPIAADGNPESDTYLPPETFVIDPISMNSREAVIVRSDASAVPGPVIVTIPSSSAFVFANARAGNLSVFGYRAGTLVATTSFGRLSLENAGGTVFLQSNRGAIVARDSKFARIRVRSLQGNVTFERCVVSQIEATSIAGSIVFDGGSFQPGLARFESSRGDVAIGSETAAELSAHSATGRTFASFLAPADVRDRGGESHVTIAGGGPVVTAASQSGNVYLYDGSLRTRNLPPAWQAPVETLTRPGIRRASQPPARVPQIERPPKYRVPFQPPRPTIRERFLQ